MSRALVVVPTHNEVQNIDVLLGRIRAVLADIDVLIVDDDSTDGTRRVVEARCLHDEHLRMLERPSKAGLGDAYVHAFGIALDEGYDVVVQLDADLSHDPAALPAMLAVSDLDVDLVIGSRYVPGSRVVGWPRRRTWLSRWANRYVTLMLGLAVNDATGGLRAYRSGALRTIGLNDVQASGYAFQIEMTYRVVRAGMSVVELPICFTDRTAGASKMNRRVVGEAFRLVTLWGVMDAVSLQRRRRAYPR